MIFAIGQGLLQFSTFLSYIHFLSLANAGWLKCVLSFINTNGSIPALKTLPGKVIPDPSSRGLKGLGSRLVIK